MDIVEQEKNSKSFVWQQNEPKTTLKSDDWNWYLNLFEFNHSFSLFFVSLDAFSSNIMTFFHFSSAHVVNIDISYEHEKKRLFLLHIVIGLLTGSLVNRFELFYINAYGRWYRISTTKCIHFIHHMYVILCRKIHLIKHTIKIPFIYFDLIIIFFYPNWNPLQKNWKKKSNDSNALMSMILVNVYELRSLKVYDTKMYISKCAHFIEMLRINCKKKQKLNR